MQTKKKLTGWLVLLIVWIGFFGGVGALWGLTTVEGSYSPYLAEYPNLHMAVTLLQLLMMASIVAWVYTAWLLYRREPGTLRRAQNGFLVGAGLRLAENYAVPLLGGLPSEIARTLVLDAFPVSLFVIVFTGVWYLYLLRSTKVREIYAD